MQNKRKLVFEGKALSLGLEKASFPDGSTDTLEIIRHPGGAGTVALNQSGQVCLIRQYRYAVDDWLWEIPAGRIEGGEEPQFTAQRELGEEAGISAQEWLPIGSIFPSPGICDERIYLYLARNLSSIDMAHEPSEIIEVHWVPLSESISWIRAGEIVDAKTVIALFCSQAYLAENSLVNTSEKH